MPSDPGEPAATPAQKIRDHPPIGRRGCRGTMLGMEDTPADPPSPGPTRRSFRRSTSDRYLGGVAGGVAERLSIDAAFIRLGLVAVTLYLAYADDRGAHALVLVPYALAWALVPTASERPLLLRLRDRDALRELVLIAATLAVALLLLSRPSSIVVLGLGGLAVILLRDRAPERDAVHTQEAGPAPRIEADRIPRRLLPRWPDVTRARRPRPEPALWPLTVGLLVVIAVFALAMDQATDGRVDPRIVVDVALLAIGSVLALSAWRGRARITLLAVLALLPLWVATSVPDVGRFAGQGTLTARPTSVPAASTTGTSPELDYEIGYGTLDLDLRDLPLSPGSALTVRVGVTAGRATLTVPASSRIAVDGTIGLGTMTVDAPDHFLSDSDAAADRHFHRSYPALGTECQDAAVAADELAALAERTGLVSPDASGNHRPPSEIVAAISDAGFPRPTVDHVEEIQDGGDGGFYDSQGNLVPTTSIGDGTIRKVTFWRVQVARRDFALCRPVPAPSDPTTIRIQPTIGLGTLEIHRV